MKTCRIHFCYYTPDDLQTDVGQSLEGHINGVHVQKSVREKVNEGESPQWSSCY